MHARVAKSICDTRRPPRPRVGARRAFGYRRDRIFFPASRGASRGVLIVHLRSCRGRPLERPAASISPREPPSREHRLRSHACSRCASIRASLASSSYFSPASALVTHDEHSLDIRAESLELQLANLASRRRSVIHCIMLSMNTRVRASSSASAGSGRDPQPLARASPRRASRVFFSVASTMRS